MVTTVKNLGLALIGLSLLFLSGNCYADDHYPSFATRAPAVISGEGRALTSEVGVYRNPGLNEKTDRLAEIPGYRRLAKDSTGSLFEVIPGSLIGKTLIDPAGVRQKIVIDSSSHIRGGTNLPLLADTLKEVERFNSQR